MEYYCVPMRNLIFIAAGLLKGCHRYFETWSFTHPCPIFRIFWLWMQTRRIPLQYRRKNRRFVTVQEYKTSHERKIRQISEPDDFKSRYAGVAAAAMVWVVENGEEGERRDGNSGCQKGTWRRQTPNPFYRLRCFVSRP